METDPVLIALFGKLDHSRTVAKNQQGFIDDAARQLQEAQTRKRNAEGETEKLTDYLDKNFPGWEVAFDDWKETVPRGSGL